MKSSGPGEQVEAYLAHIRLRLQKERDQTSAQAVLERKGATLQPSKSFAHIIILDDPPPPTAADITHQADADARDEASQPMKRGP